MIADKEKSAMIIQITQLQEGKPQRVREELDARNLDIEFVDLHYVGPVTVEAIVEKNYQTVHLHGTISRRVEHICARCLTQVTEDIREPVDYDYDIQGIEEIDTLGDIRDNLLLSHPDRFLCRESCKGFCPQCGADLNVATCQCRLNEQQSPFSELKNWLGKRKQNSSDDQRS